MLSTKAREGKKMGYLVKAINHAMRRKAEQQSSRRRQSGAVPAQPKTPPGAVIKIEGGLELPAPPPVEIQKAFSDVKMSFERRCS